MIVTDEMAEMAAMVLNKRLASGVGLHGVSRDMLEAALSLAPQVKEPPPPQTRVAGITFPLPSWQEQAAFEAWATESRYEMHQHPLHYLFVDKQTNAARQGWKAALAFVRQLQDAALATTEGKDNGQ